MLTKRQKRFSKYQVKFEKGILTKQELNLLDREKIREYLEKELKNKFNINKFECIHCGVNLLYDDGYVSEEELAKLRYKKKD